MPSSPYPLARGRTAALVAGGLFVLAGVLFGRLPGEARWVSDLSNAAHGPAFAVVTAVIFALLRQPSRPRLSIFAEYSLAILISTLLGALVELLQHYTGRDAGLTDLWTNSLGTLAVAGGLLAVDRRVPATRRRNGCVVAIVACALMLAPLAVTAAAYMKRHRDFPTLVDSRTPLAAGFLRAGLSATIERAPLPRDLQTDERDAIGVRARLLEKAGWILVLPEPVADWRGHTRLNLDVANPTDEPLALRLRVFDKVRGRGRHTGFRESFEIAPQSRAVHSVPFTALTSGTGGTQLDMARIHSVVIALARGNRAREFYLVRIWLD